MSTTKTNENYHRILRKIQSFSTGRSVPNLIAVSKSQPIERIISIHKEGQVWFGENYAQELLEKAKNPELDKVKWAFIGSLQSNKIPKLVEFADRISTVASQKHARLISKNAIEVGKDPFVVDILVNSANESSKSGVSWDELPQLINFCRTLPGINLGGILVIPEKSLLELPSEKRLEHYKDLYGIAVGYGVERVSLGMSSDLEEAIKAGSHEVRIGTAIFGERPKKAGLRD